MIFTDFLLFENVKEFYHSGDITFLVYTYFCLDFASVMVQPIFYTVAGENLTLARLIVMISTQLIEYCKNIFP